MRIGIISDIHCNLAGLDVALEQMHGVDEVICAGDAIYQYRFSNEVVDRLRARGVRMVLGNHEETFLSPDGERARRSPRVRADALDWLARHEQTLSATVAGKRLLVVHGSPWEPFKEYLYPTSPTLRRFHDFEADFVVLGHTHYQMALRVGRTLLINPGSAGEARDPRNANQLSFAILDTASEAVEFRNYPDPQRASMAGQLPVRQTLQPDADAARESDEPSLNADPQFR